MPFASRVLLFRWGAFLLLLAHGPLATAAEGEKSKVVVDGSRISIEYTLFLEDGTVADTNVGGAPLVYQQGGSQLLPALESQLAGLAVGDNKEVSLSAAEGYGEVDPKLFHVVPASDIPEDARTVGTALVAQSTGGQQQHVRVHELKGEEIVLDLNHPLAGQPLRFDIKILAIE